jgi:hypothetical protein
MSGLRSRRKGLRVEYLARDALIAGGISARKVSRACQPGHDVEAGVHGRLLKVQVRLRAKNDATVYAQLDGCEVLLLKADRKPILAILPLSLAIEIARAAKASAEVVRWGRRLFAA